jgi:hypothetical protein
MNEQTHPPKNQKLNLFLTNTKLHLILLAICIPVSVLFTLLSTNINTWTAFYAFAIPFALTGIVMFAAWILLFADFTRFIIRKVKRAK